MSADYSPENLARLACVDPWALQKQVGSGNPEAVREWGRQFRQAAAAAADAVTLGQRADRTVAQAYHNNGDAVFDAGASSAQTQVMLAGGGEKMEEVARIVIDVGDGLAEAKRIADARVEDVDAEIAATIRRRNSYMLDNAAALLATPNGVAEAEQRFLQQAVDRVGMRGREVKRAVDAYDQLLANRIGWLREWGYQARPPQREKDWTEDVTDFLGGVKDGATEALEGTVGMVDDLLIHPTGENWARYAGGVGALASGMVSDPLGTLDQVFTGGNIGKGEYGNAVGEVLGGALLGKGLNKLGEAGRLGRAAEDVRPRVPGVLDEARHPADPGEPFPQLTVGEKSALDQRLAELEAQYPKDFEDYSVDPDRRTVDPESMDEARVALDMRDQGRLPPDLQRPSGPGQGDFYSPGENKYYDLKGVHADFPPGDPDFGSGKPFDRGYLDNSERFVENLRKQIEEKQRVPVLDVRNANQAAIDDLRRVVAEKGWNGSVIWYP